MLLLGLWLILSLLLLPSLDRLTLTEWLRLPSGAVPNPNQPGRMPFGACADVVRLDHVNRIFVEQGLARTVAWYRAHLGGAA